MPTCSGGSGNVRSRRSAGGRAGRGGGARTLPARVAGGGPPRTRRRMRSSRRSGTCRGRRSRRRSSRPTCCPRASAATGPADLDAMPRAATSSGSAPAALGADDGRVRSASAIRPALGAGRPAPGEAAPPTVSVRTRGARRDPRAPRLARAPRSGPTSCRRRHRRRARCAPTALWDLVWAGEVTNDTLAPLRAFVLRAVGRIARRKRRPRPGQARSRRTAGGRRTDGRSVATPCSTRRSRPRLRTPARCSCSTGTASSRVRRRWPRAPPAASPASTRC